MESQVATPAVQQPLNGRIETSTRVEVVQVDPTTALRWLTDRGYGHQRPVRRTHVDYLAYEMRAGRFRLSEIRFVHFNGRAYLTDGQHRLHAVVESKIATPFTVVHIYADSLGQVDDDYIHTGIGMGRTTADAFGPMHLLGVSGLTSKSQLNSLAAAVRLVAGGFSNSALNQRNPTSKSRVFLHDLILEWAGPARDYFQAVSGAESDLGIAFLRRAVLGVAVVTFRDARDKAVEFWGAVAENDGLAKGTPERALVNFLLRTPGQNIPAGDYARYVAAAWNAAYEGRSLGVHKVVEPTRSRPIKIEGTPYNGRDLILHPALIEIAKQQAGE